MFIDVGFKYEYVSNDVYDCIYVAESCEKSYRLSPPTFVPNIYCLWMTNNRGSYRAVLSMIRFIIIIYWGTIKPNILKYKKHVWTIVELLILKVGNTFFKFIKIQVVGTLLNNCLKMAITQVFSE